MRVLNPLSRPPLRGPGGLGGGAPVASSFHRLTIRRAVSIMDLEDLALEGLAIFR